MFVPIFVFIFLCSSAFAEVTPTEINSVFTAFQGAYFSELNEAKQEIVFNRKIGSFDWLTLDLVLASYVASKHPMGNDRAVVLSHEVTITGGLLRLPGLDADGAALILCHELGHGLGGPPYKDHDELNGKQDSFSTEGQADYFATFSCLPKVWTQLDYEKRVDMPIAKKKCSTRFQKDSLNYNQCLRTFAAMRGFIVLLQHYKPQETRMNFEESDSREVESVTTDPRFYPTSQCRLDTLMAGALKEPQPRCWYISP